MYIYFTNILPAIAFGFFLTDRTAGQIGILEVMLSMGVSGTLYGLLAGQPLVIVGVTGPISIFYDTMFHLAASWGYAFLPWMAWVAFWAALMHVALGALNASDLVRWTTRFSGEIFGVLIALVYIARAIQEFVSQFDAQPLAAALLALLLGLGTWLVAAALSGAGGWVVLTKGLRGLIADYAAAVAIVLFTALQFLPKFAQAGVEHLSMPLTFRPTADRAWLVPFWEVPVGGVFAALLPAFILTVLFYFDHNVSAMLAQQPEYRLRKPPSYNWDFVVLGLTVFLTGLLGLPANNGLIPQSPLHVRALARIREVRRGHAVVEEWDGVCETRVSSVAHAVLIGVTCAPPFLYLISWIPRGVLAGLFLYMGFASFHGNELADRVLLQITRRRDADGRLHARYLPLPPRRTTAFTLIQAVIAAAVFGITYTPADIVFPVLIALLVPLRLYGLSRVFTAEELALLDEDVPRPLHTDALAEALPSVVTALDGEGAAKDSPPPPPAAAAAADGTAAGNGHAPEVIELAATTTDEIALPRRRSVAHEVGPQES